MATEPQNFNSLNLNLNSLFFTEVYVKKSRLLENIFSMVTLRAMEYILSFILIPYLLRVLGPAQYGAIAFMQGIIGYFNLCINYGFNMTAPRDIAQAAEKDIPRLFSTYFWATVLLWFGVTVLFFVGYGVLQAIWPVKLDLPLFFAVYTSIIGLVIFPIWYFQGIQEMRYITILNMVGRFVTMGLIFVFVRNPSDYILAAFLQSCTPLFAGILCWKVIHDMSPGLLGRPVWEDMKKAYKEGWQIFLSSLAINLYTSSDVVILGILTNNTIVGYYSGADKLINCIKRGIGAVNDAVYPYISKVMRESKESGIHFLRKQLVVYMVCGVIGGVLLYVLSPWVVPLLLGPKYISSIGPLQIMSFVPLVVAMSNVMGYETMLPLGMEKIYSKVLMVASVFNLVIIYPLISWGGAEGTSWAVLCTETLVTALMAVILWKKRILVRN